MDNFSIKLITNRILSAIQFLGFDLTAQDKQIAFNSTLFTRPNSKAFNVIAHFLLVQLDPERAHRSFSRCWPIYLPDQQKNFNQVVLTWLTELHSAHKAMGNKQTESLQPTHTQLIQEHHQAILQSVKIPMITKSLMISPVGIKVCELLFSLTQHVLIVQILKISKLYF